MMKIEIALKRMGYRCLGNDTWSKPIGYGSLGVNAKTLVIKSVFQGANNEILVWNSGEIDAENPLNSLKYFECWESGLDERQPYPYEGARDFSFLTQEEIAEIMLR